jgi:acyl homoserine lactone synthase
MSVVVVDWQNAHLYGEAWVSHHRLRHKIFIERSRWDIPSYDGLEYDQFDTPAAKYILWLDAANHVRGVVRLLPTTRPYMIETLWPQLLFQPPRSEQIWEATRFGCDHSLDSHTHAQVVAELIAGCLEYGLVHGITKLLGLMPVAVFKRILTVAGCRVEIQDNSLRMGRHSLAVGYIDVSWEALEEVRARASRQGVPCQPGVISRGCEIIDFTRPRHGGGAESATRLGQTKLPPRAVDREAEPCARSFAHTHVPQAAGLRRELARLDGVA